jgi:2-keto-4-pentenoate hydratase/2-oxohepta-3-ene-1,7-dioic acid hydratase in catechol pathway
MQWARFRSNDGRIGFGAFEGGQIAEYEGDMFGAPWPTGRSLAPGEFTLQSPCTPSKIVALWNNFHALRLKLGKAVPAHPMFLIKPGTSVIGPNTPIRRPTGYTGKVAYEGELGIVIGKLCKDVPLSGAGDRIFGYTCVNDVTASDILNRDPTFPQWARAKGFDGSGPFGPVITSGIDPASLIVRTILNGAERQNYPIADMIFSAQQLVSKISHDMTLAPGDLIACGTSVGVGVMKEQVNTVTVAIDGIGELTNEFRQ